MCNHRRHRCLGMMKASILQITALQLAIAFYSFELNLYKLRAKVMRKTQKSLCFNVLLCKFQTKAALFNVCLVY
jgi:hypothetical protein